MSHDAQKILITSALLYANGPLHFGHLAGAYLTADCFARFERLRGKDVLFLCGSDEYGVAITLSAELAGHSPQEHVDHFHTLNKELFSKLNFSFDHYSRTTWEGHHKPVNEYFHDLLANGYIEPREDQHLYSEADHRFLADRYVLGGCPKCKFEQARGDECPKCGASYEATDLTAPRSRLTEAPLTLRTTKHWYLRLDLLADQLKSWLATKEWRPNVLHFLQHYLDDLKPRAITRDGDWGIPVPLPEAKGKVFYVWFEACIGYLSAAQEWAQQLGQPEKWKRYWCDPDTHFVQFIGKDNIFFHGIFFPAMTMGQNQPYKLVDDLPANEFLNLEGRQFSKSDNWTIDLPDFLSRYTADQIRYTLAANAPENGDAEFTWHDFQMRCNAELVGKLGNLANRVLIFTHRRTNGRLPPCHQKDEGLLEQIRQLVTQAEHHYANHSLRKVCQTLMELAHLGNTYFDARKPWEAAKDEARQADMEDTLYHCFECLKGLALIANPLMPEASEKLWHLLGFDTPLTSNTWNEALEAPLQPDTPLPATEILFEKVPEEQIEAEIIRLKG